MKQLQQYIKEVLGEDIQYKQIPKQELVKMPFLIGELYRLFDVMLLGMSFILVEKIDSSDFSIMQTEIHFRQIREALNKKVVLLANEMTNLNRSRLIAKGINFIVPGKQLFIPQFLMDLREDFRVTKTSTKKQTLLPSAQFIVLYKILNQNSRFKIEDLSFKQLAHKLKYTPMAITNAAENLEYHNVCTIEGDKEKYLKFKMSIPEMWNDLVQRKLIESPVLKTVFVDKVRGDYFFPLCNASALPEYSDMNPSKQQYRAVNKNQFYKLTKEGAFVNINNHEGEICIEVWKYDPLVLTGVMVNDLHVVDPLSLYLTLKEIPDERTEMALENILSKYVW